MHIGCVVYFLDHTEASQRPCFTGETYPVSEGKTEWILRQALFTVVGPHPKWEPHSFARI